MNTIATKAKALVALVGAVATALLGIYADGDLGKTLTIIVAVCTALATYGVPNADPAGEHQDESVTPPHRRNDRGAVSIEGAFVIAILVVVLLVVLRAAHLL